MYSVKFDTAVFTFLSRSSKYLVVLRRVVRDLVEGRLVNPADIRLLDEYVTISRTHFSPRMLQQFTSHGTYTRLLWEDADEYQEILQPMREAEWHAGTSPILRMALAHYICFDQTYPFVRWVESTGHTLRKNLIEDCDGF